MTSFDFSAAPAFKDNFYTAAAALLNLDATQPVQVTFGHPGQSQAGDIVGFLDVSSEQEAATLGTNRTRDETLTLEVIISVYRGGGVEMEKVCSDRAYALLGALEKWARVTDTTVGGSVLRCALTAHQSEGQTDDEFLGSGRLIEIKATFTAKARIGMH